MSDFLATSDGLALTKAFMRIKDAKLRRRIVDLVEQIAGDDERLSAARRDVRMRHRPVDASPTICPHLDRARGTLQETPRGHCHGAARSPPILRGSVSRCHTPTICSPANPFPKVIPDKVCDQISDAILDAFIENDIKLGIADDSQVNTRLGCETLCTTNKIVIAGEGRGQAPLFTTITATRRWSIAS